MLLATHVLNNPINYSDPSGQSAICDEEGREECTNKKYHPYNPLMGLTSFGESAYAVLQRLNDKNNPGWWNDYGNRKVTVDYLVILVLASELGSFNDPESFKMLFKNLIFAGETKEAIEWIKIAATGWFFDHCKTNSGSGCSVNPTSLLNWIGEAFESQIRLFQDNGVPEKYEKILPYAEVMLNNIYEDPLNNRTSVYNNEYPIHWGNGYYYVGAGGYSSFPPGSRIVLGLETNYATRSNAWYLISYNDEARMK